MSRADLLKEIADHHYALADLYQQLAGESATAPVSAARPAAANPPAAPASTDEVLGECPVHFTRWTLKEAGVSKAGKRYGAFWKCDGKNADGTWCSKKPRLEWVRTHDPEEAAA